ncbi:hypothetical protein M9458_014182, partial [Cirrhinus mrigala]
LLVVERDDWKREVRIDGFSLQHGIFIVQGHLIRARGSLRPIIMLFHRYHRHHIVPFEQE